MLRRPGQDEIFSVFSSGHHLVQGSRIGLTYFGRRPYDVRIF